VSHVLVQASDKLILDERIHPIVVAGAEDYTFETFHFERKQWIFKPALTILATEVESETELAIARPIPVAAAIPWAQPRTAMDAKPAVDLKA